MADRRHGETLADVGQAQPPGAPLRVRRWLGVLLVACALAAGMELVVHRHVGHAWESLWGFYALYGFLAAALLALGARLLRRLVMRDERYYDRDA